jgi:phosphoserine phosphatase
MVGDGATDMQAKPPADLFIGYGGVVVREAVRDGADLFVTDLKVRHPKCKPPRILPLTQ